MRFNSATAPGVNRWEAVQPSEASAVRCSPRHRLETRIEVEWAQSQPRESYCSYMPLNSDPRMRREHTGMYVAGAQQTGGVARHAATTTPQLGAALNRGYGRAPTAHVYTSADTLLSTTSYQSHAAAAPAPQQQRLQAYAFTCADGSTEAWARSSASAPASPMGHRTLLYTRATASTQQPYAPPATAPAADLLDRLTLLRRLAPTTGPSARPQQLTAAAQHFTPAASAACNTHAAAVPTGWPAAAAGSGCRRWAWDDSLVGCSSASQPIAFLPAVGWRYCGDVAAVGPAAGWEAGTLASASAAAGGRDGALNVSVAGGGSLEMQQQQQQGEEGEVLLVVRSPRPHRPHEEEDAAAAWDAAPGGSTDGSGAARCSSCGGGRGAFRPPGPLQHKFGNKPPPGRPTSAPSAAEHARAAGLRECGCPRSPRHPWYPNNTGRSSGGGVQHTHGSSSAVKRRQRVQWQDEEAVAVVTCRPRSAAAAEALAACRQQPCSPVTAAGMMSSRPTSPHMQSAPRVVQSRGRESGWAASGGNCVAGPTTTTTVSVSTPEGDTDVVVVSSPRAADGSGLGPAEHEVSVFASSPRARVCSPTRGTADHSRGSSDLLTTTLRHNTHAASASPPRRQQPASAAASPRGETQQREGRTKLTVSMPAGGGGGSFRITADASSAGAAAAAGGASPIKAWRPAPAATAPSAAPRAQQRQQEEEEEWGQEWAQAPSQGRAPAADLERLESEVKRREKSFGQLLSELDRISAKCAQLTSGNTGGGSDSGARHGGSPTRNSTTTSTTTVAAVASTSEGAAARQAHTTHRFESASTPARAGGRGSSYAGGRAAAGTGAASAAAQADREDWGWENLLAFEEKIRKQQRKLVEQGVLPPEFS